MRLRRPPDFALVPDADAPVSDADAPVSDAGTTGTTGTTGGVLFPDVDEVTTAAAAAALTELLLPAGFLAAALKAFFAVFPFLSSTVK